MQVSITYFSTFSFYYKALFTYTKKFGLKAIDKMGHATHSFTVLSGCLILIGLSIIIPIALLLPVLLSAILLPITIPLLIIGTLAEILNMIYKKFIIPLEQEIFKLKPISFAISSTIKYLRRKHIVGYKFDIFSQNPEILGVGLMHYILLSGFIILPIYFGLQHIPNPGILDYALHVLCFDLAIGIVFQFSPFSAINDKLKDRPNLSLWLAAVNGIIIGTLQSAIWHISNFELDLGNTAIWVSFTSGLVLTKIIDLVFQKMLNTIDNLNLSFPFSVYTG